MKQPAEIVEGLLADCEPPRRKSRVHDSPGLAEAIVHFLDLKAADDERVKGLTLRWFYTRKLRERFDGPKAYETIKLFVREELRRDTTTGKDAGS